MMAPDTLFERAFIHDAGPFAEGTLVTFGGVPPGLLEGSGRVFHEHYVERFRREPECYAASAYDATGVILTAIESVGRVDRAAITRAAMPGSNIACPSFTATIARMMASGSASLSR